MRSIFLLLTLSACWTEDDDEECAEGTYEDLSFESLSDALDLSVNDASAGPGDETEDGLRLYTAAGEAEVGAFNGSGTGNKAMAGLPGYDGLGLGDLSSLAFETVEVTGGSTPYFNVVVDLACDCETLVVIVADATQVASPTETEDGALRYEFLAESTQWKAVGGLDDLLPTHLSAGAGGTLTDVVAAYPDACLRDADTGDNGLPADVVTTAVMLILGDSLNTSELEHRVSAVEVGG